MGTWTPFKTHHWKRTRLFGCVGTAETTGYNIARISALSPYDGAGPAGSMLNKS